MINSNCPISKKRIKEILNNNDLEVNEYEILAEYYEMPYGTMKAQTGDPDDFLRIKLRQELLTDDDKLLKTKLHQKLSNYGMRVVSNRELQKLLKDNI